MGELRCINAEIEKLIFVGNSIGIFLLFCLTLQFGIVPSLESYSLFYLLLQMQISEEFKQRKFFEKGRNTKFSYKENVTM